MSDQFAERVAGRPQLARLVDDRRGGEAIRAPGQQHIDRNKRPFVVAECSGHLGAEDAERGYLARDGCAHDILQGHLGDDRSQVTEHAVFLVLCRAVDDVETFRENR